MINIEENVELAKFTTFQIGGKADLLIKTKTSSELVEALNWAADHKIDFIVLGGGSNVLVSDDGFRGLVIINKGGELQLSGQEVVVDSGYFTARLALETRKAGLAGLEFASAIPGTVGGASVGNAGAYGRSFSDFISKVEIWDNGRILELSNQDLKFVYRGSCLKDQTKKVVTRVFLRLGSEPELGEEDMASDRQKRANDYAGANAGSYFKNIEATDLSTFEKEKVKPFITHGKVSVGKMIESLGLKGTHSGGAVVSEKHANVIVNTGGAAAEDVIALEELVKTKVKAKFGIVLHSEVIKIGGKFKA